MGETPTIPYVGKALWYLCKVAIIVAIMTLALRFIGFADTKLIVTTALFLAFTLDRAFCTLILCVYLSMLFVLWIIPGASLFIYIAAVLMDTMVMLMYVKARYRLVETP